MVEASSLNPFSSFSIGGMGAVGKVLLLIFIVVLILGGIGALVWIWLERRKYKFSIPLYKRLGNIPTRVATYKAKIYPIGRAGDRLWVCRKIKKFIEPATLQSAPNEFMHWEREDGEWINFAMGDLDETQKRAGVKYIKQDMRSQRLATDRLLEQRLMKKTWWEKYGLIIGYVMVYLVITIALVVIFYQFGEIVNQISGLISKLDTMITTKEGGGQSIVPAFILIGSTIKRRFREWPLFKTF